MGKIPFDIKYRPEIEAGKYKVVTRDELPARIICWDRNDIEYPMVALVKSKCGEETPFTYGNMGNFFTAECDNDLFLVPPEPELTEFERAFGEELFNEPFDEDVVEEIKAKSAKLLGLARKELQLEGLPMWHKAVYSTEGRWRYSVVSSPKGPMLYDHLEQKEICIKDLEGLHVEE